MRVRSNVGVNRRPKTASSDDEALLLGAESSTNLQDSAGGSVLPPPAEILSILARAMRAIIPQYMRWCELACFAPWAKTAPLPVPIAVFSPLLFYHVAESGTSSVLRYAFLLRILGAMGALSYLAVAVGLLEAALAATNFIALRSPWRSFARSPRAGVGGLAAGMYGAGVLVVAIGTVLLPVTQSLGSLVVGSLLMQEGECAAATQHSSVVGPHAEQQV